MNLIYKIYIKNPFFYNMIYYINDSVIIYVSTVKEFLKLVFYKKIEKNLNFKNRKILIYNKN